MSSEPIDPDRIRDAERNTFEVFNNAAEYGAEVSLLLAALVDEAGGEVTLPAGWRERMEQDDRPVLMTEHEDGSTTFLRVEHPVAEQAQAVLDGGPDWVHASTGRTVKVTGAEQDVVVTLVQLEVGKWSEPQRWHADCFLREHVLAAGVPLLGGDA